MRKRNEINLEKSNDSFGGKKADLVKKIVVNDV